MHKRTVVLVIFAIIGGVLGAAYLPRTWLLFGVKSLLVDNVIVNILLGAIIFLILGAIFAKSFLRLISRVEGYLNKIGRASCRERV